MSFKTRDDLVQSVISTIGLVSGTSVNVYTEDAIEVEIQHTFDLLFRKKDWRHLSEWRVLTVNPANGLFTADVSAVIREWQHIRHIYEAGTDRKILLSTGREHLSVTGSKAHYFAPLRYDHASFSNRVIEFFPSTADHDVDIFIKIKPADFIGSHTVPFPSDIMDYAVAWQILANNGMNPDAAERARMLFQVAYDDYEAELSAREFGRHVRNRNIVQVGNLL